MPALSGFDHQLEIKLCQATTFVKKVVLKVRLLSAMLRDQQAHGGQVSVREEDEKQNYIGYARVSTKEQDLAPQVEALRRAGVPKGSIFTEKISGTARNRIALEKAIRALREGDVFVVASLDRLGRTIISILLLADRIRARGAGLRSLTQDINTETLGGKVVFHIFAALAELERDLIRQRTLAGLEVAKAKGVKFGRPSVLTETRRARIDELDAQGVPATKIAAEIGVSRPVVYGYLKLKRDAEEGSVVQEEGEEK